VTISKLFSGEFIKVEKIKKMNFHPGNFDIVVFEKSAMFNSINLI